MKPLTVEILAYAPTAFYHCQHCEIIWQQAGVGQLAHAEQLANNLPADLMHDYHALSLWTTNLVNRHCGRLVVQIIDAASIEGFLKSLRYGVRRYPAVIISGGHRISPADLPSAEAAIERRLAANRPAA
jgi:hypothetical protein